MVLGTVCVGRSNGEFRNRNHEAHQLVDLVVRMVPTYTQEQVDEIATAAAKRGGKEAAKAVIRRSLVAYLFVLVIIGYVFFDSNRDSSNQRDAIVSTGDVAVVIGCNRDFQLIEKLRGVFQSAQLSTIRSFEQKRIDSKEFAESQAFYKAQLDGLKLPDCRNADDILSTDENHRVLGPVPLHP
jgi:hypothetical protein